VKDVVFLTSKAKSNLASSVVRSKQLSALYSLLRPELNVHYHEVSRGVSERKLGRINIVNKAFMTNFPARSLPPETPTRRFILDSVDAKIRPEYVPRLSGLISTNFTEVKAMGALYPGKLIFYVPLHPNLEVAGFAAQGHDFRIGYFGETFNCRYLPELVARCGVEVVTTPTNRQVGSWARRFTDFPAHISFRRDRLSDGRKPFTKGIFAALSGAVYVGDAVPEAKYLLGEDYPFFAKGDSLDDAVAVIETARENFGNTYWDIARSRMENVARESSVQRVLWHLDQVVDHFL